MSEPPTESSTTETSIKPTTETSIKEYTELAEIIAPTEEFTVLKESVSPASAEEYTTVQGIRIYSGLTTKSRELLSHNLEQYRKALARRLTECEFPRLGDLTSSTITAQGCISGIQFNEEELITRLPQPTGNIRFIGCNYGELINADQKAKPDAKAPARPKPKTKPKRVMKGSGKYFGSQVTFDIRNAESAHEYKIKLFRTGVFQVPHVRSPDMNDLCGPIITLLDYLRPIFGPDIAVVDFKAVMRNYKSELQNANLFVDLQQMNQVLRELKDADTFDIDEIRGQRLNIAEITYNVDRHASLLVKFNRPTATDPTKQTTVKLIKSGKINFDGGSNRMEIEEIYLIISTIYAFYTNRVLVDQRDIIGMLNGPITTQTPAPNSPHGSDSDVSLYDYHLALVENPALLTAEEIHVNPRAMQLAQRISKQSKNEIFAANDLR